MRKANELISAIVLVILWLGFQPQAMAARQYAGLKMQSVVTAGNQNIDLAIWYPTAVASSRREQGPYSIDVSAGAPVNPGRYPLIIISHGTGGNSLGHHQLASGLAQAGFVVVALSHPGDNSRDRSMVGKVEYFSERPRQVSRVLDVLLADESWAASIDSQRIGFIGHSAGGFTGAALIGATPSLVQTVRHCAEQYSNDPWFCGVSGSKERAIANARNIDYLPIVPSSSDPRIKAAVLIAPVGAFFTESSLRNIKAPVRVYVAAKDEILVPQYHADFLARSVNGAETVTVADGGHFMLSSKLNLKIAVGADEVNFDPNGFDRNKLLVEVSQALPLWFASHWLNCCGL